MSKCNAYLDDLIVYLETEAEHLHTPGVVFHQLAKASLTVNLAKCEFGKTTGNCLERRVEQGQVQPVEAEVAAIASYPALFTCHELCRYFFP